MRFFRHSRPVRAITALLVLTSLLFMQLAVAAHACANLRDAPAPMPAMEMTMSMHGEHAADMAQMADCCDTDEVASAAVLCDQHCQPAMQSLDKPATPDVQPFVAAALISTDTAASALPAGLGLTRANGLFSTRINAPPLSIRNCCFRI